METWKFTQRISMDCTQEQYEKYLKEELEKMGYNEICIERWYDKGLMYVCNNYDCINGYVSNTGKERIEANDRTYLGKFNAPLFLALAAMTDKQRGGYGEYWIGNITGNYYRQFNAVSICDTLNSRKATVSEIMEKFGEKKDKSPEDIMKDMSDAIGKIMENISKNLLLKAFEVKLAEQGKRFDKERCELVDIPKYKEAVMGELAIFWNKAKDEAICGIFLNRYDGRYSPNRKLYFDNAILFESIDQYKQFTQSK